MIRVSRVLDDGKTVGITLCGHAGFAEEGKDIVCAAVTSAVRLTDCAITEVHRGTAVTDERDGYLSYRLMQPTEAQRDQLEALFRYLRQLETEYPDNIKIMEV